MSIASEITRLQGVKSDILQAISDKGVTVPDGSALADCPELIGLIPTGGGGGGVVPGCIYLTYFSNFNLDTKDDTPIIGSAKASWANAGSDSAVKLSFPKMRILGGDVDSVKWYHARGNDTSNSFTIDDSIKQISIEFFRKEYFPGDYGTGFGIGPLYVSNGGVIDGYRIAIPNASGAETKLYNGAILNTQWGRFVVYRPNDFSTTDANLCFYSLVVDFENKELYYYFNGILICSITNIDTSRIFGFRFDSYRNDLWINLTQAAIFNYAKNSDDKTTYDVPQIPYIIYIKRANPAPNS